MIDIHETIYLQIDTFAYNKGGQSFCNVFTLVCRKTCVGHDSAKFEAMALAIIDLYLCEGINQSVSQSVENSV